MTEPLEQGFLLSPQQLRAWRLQKDGAALCSVLCALRMEGDLDRRALRRALAATVARHEILRTAFRHPAGLSMPLQVILEPGPVSLTEVDLRELSRQHQSASTTALLSELGGLPFHLERGEGWRAALVRLGHGEHEMLFALSAVCGDAGAFEPLAADLLAAYTRQVAGEGPDPEPPLQYADVAEWQNSLLEGEDAAEGLDTWREHWRGSDLDARISLPLPLQESEAAPGPFVPRQEAVPLARETAGALTSLAQAWDCPLQALLLTAWKAVIQRGTGRDESLVGVLYPGRDTEELRGVVGPLARYLPIVARFSTESSLQEAVAKVRQAMKRAESWGEYFSWEHVAGNGHGAGGFPVCFEAGMKDWTQAVDGLRASSAWRSSNGTVLDSFSIALSCTGEGEDLRLALRYDPRRFRREAARRLAGRVAALLGSVAARPEASLADHPAMAEDELKLWLRLSMAPSAADRGRKGKTLHAVFEEQVDRTPDRLAVVAGDSHLTFRELDVRANCLAHYLRAAGAGPEVVVALCLERSVEAVMALLAVWKAGAAYVPLDPTQPTERLVYLLEDTGAPLLVTDSRLASGLPGAGRLPGLRTVRLDEEAAEIALQPAERPAGGAGFRSLAYVIYTSGSTGRPKGVQIEHRSALHLLTALEAAVLDPLAQAGLLPDPLLASLNAPMIFDASIQQLALLLDGHALCIVPQDIRADGTALLAFLRDRQVDLLDCTPSQLRLLVRAGLLDDAAGPRCVLTAGEAVDEPLWRRLAHAERTVCFNLYGPTECSVDATFHRIEPGSSRPTIGRPLAGYEVFLLDQFLQPVPLGAPGELCLGGAGLARGYLLRPDLTAERFVPHPFAGRPGERLYRTGDLGCHLPNGDLEFLGRLDHQVKIRGFRIELGEIEEVLAEQAGVHDAVVVAHGSATEDQRLVAYLVGDTPTDALRQALRQRLPDYMMPATFVTLAALPLTPNGKVDRKALPAPAWHGEEEYLPPRTPVEEILAGIWAELLGLERVGVADHFFDLGGHSLLATQVMSRLRNTFDIEMPLRELFAAPRLADLAARVEEVRWAGTLSPVPPLLALPREGSLPLSFAQQRLWFIDLLEPGSPLYNISVALRAAGSLDTAVLALCFGEIVRRHEVLRTVFSAPEGSPAQVIQPAEPFRLPMVDLSELPESTREALLLKLVGQEVGRPFDLTRGPLLRCVLLRLAERDHGVVLTMHHIVSDGWSMSILVREFAALYAAFAAGRPSPLPELPVQYADFALWQRSWLQGEVLENEISFWQRQLTGLPPLLELPTDRLRPAVQSFRGANRPVRLPTELTRQLHALGRHEGATLFMVLLAVFQTLLARHSGQDDLAVGSPIAGRNRIETEGLIGFFVNTLVLRGDLTGEPTFRELLRRVRETALAAYLHQDVPFERLVEELAAERSLSHSPLFQVMLVLQNAPAESLEIRDLLLLPVAVEATTAKFDLTLSLSEHNGGLIGMVEYAADLFDATTIGRMLRHFESLTEAVVADPGRRLAEIPLLSAEEHHQLFREWNRTAAPHPHQPSLHQMFQEQARRTPGAPAVTFENRTLTYAELDNEANRVARRLRALDCGPETRVAVAMERSLELVIALLGVLKTGAAYVPLDPEYPRDRLAFMLEDARPAVLLTLGSLLPRLPEALIPVLLLDPEDRASERAQPITEPMDGMNAAYVIYTSGSTGHPKGVVVTHDNAVRLFASTHDLFRFGPEDVWTLFHSYAFDFSVWEIWGALLYGGRLVVVPWWVSRSPESFHDLLVHEKVTVLNQTPTAFRQLLRADDAARKETALRLVIFGGEALDLESLSPWMARHGSERPRLINMYGITETTVHVTYRPISAADVERGRTSPIGVPIPDLQLHLLDPASRPVPIGVPGEIYVGGRGVARGYLNRPDLTAERFVPDPFSEIPGERLYRTGDLARRRADGGVEYLGRIDTQVKVRGFRIELGEIEAALSSHPAVRDSVVIVRKDSQGDLLLTAYVVPRTDGPLPIADLRRDLEKRLPLYMIPASFVRTEALPLSPSGKVDRRALARMAPGQPEEKHEHVPPQGPEEELLAAIWEEVLGVELVGADDNFFALGGDSIRSIQVRAAAERRGLGFTVQQIFKNPTVRALIRELRRESGQEESFALVPPFGLLAPEDRLRLPQGIEDAYPLAMLQAGMLFHTEIRPESAIYHDVFSFRLRGPLDLAALRAALQEATAQHPVLRTSFDLSAYSEPLQLVHREAEVPVEAEDLRDLSKEEQDRRIASWLAGEKRRPLELHRPPLLRVQIHHLEELLFHFGFGFHHSILDGWSVATMLSGLFRHYLFLVGAGPAPAEDPPPAVTYRDFVAAERRTLASEESRRYWRGVVGNGAGTLLPRLMPRRTGTEERDMRFHPVPVSPETSNALQRLARREGVPLKSVLLAAHLRVLALLTGELDVLTGLISNGRPEGEGGERLLGLFLNTVPLRGWLAGGTWLQLVHEVFEAERNQIPHRRFPLAELQRMAGGKLLETVFNYTHFHVYQSLSGLQGLDVVGREGFEEANFPFATNFSISAPGAPIELRIEFDAAELGEELLAAADRYYRGALDALVADPEARYELAPVMPAEERVQVLATGQGETAPVPACGIHEAFLVQAGRTPEAVAVLGEEWRLTYGDLAAAASRIAWHLIRLGVGAEARVAVCLRRSPEMLAAFLGVLETGAAYVPLDPAYPQERLALLLADSGATVLVSDQASATALPETAVRRVLLDRDREAIGREPAEPPAVCVEARSPAYVIYTSGSTGTPKGVVAVHGGLLNFAWAMAAALDLGPGCRILQFASPAFDASALQIFPALISGSTLVVHPDPAALSSDELLRLCEDQGVTLLDLPGALWRQWVEDMANRGLPLPVSINAYLTGGERLSEETLRRWAPLVDGGTRFLSSYGPTEATVTTTFLSFAAREVGELALPLPLGRPLPGTRVRLLDRHLEPVPAGTPGELYIGGAGLARGYLGRPGHTAERFLPDPFAAEPGERLYHTGDLARWVPSATGSAPERLVPGHRQLASAPRLEFLGRADQQVKIRGFRVEPGEVEAALSRHPAVREAVVVAHEDESAGRRLVAYFVTEPGAAPGIAELRSFLAGTLPEFLVPSVFVNLPEMPLLSSGKVDRRALPAPDGARPEVGEYAAPASPEEELLARIWAQVLRVDRVGVHDNFFELGGDSILSIQILARANQMGMRLTARQIFEHPTVAELARVAASAPLLVAEQGLVTGAVPMTPIQRWFFTEDFAEAHHFNQAVVLEIAAPLSPATLERAVAALIAHHDALRMRFPREDGVPRQENAGLDGAVPLAWIDLSALPAGSRAAARAAAQDAVQESFDLERGPLTRLAVFDAGVAGRRLLWATHHLVVDGVSWRLLVEDLETAYKLAAQGRPPVLPAKTTSFRAWAERLVGHARSGGFQGELPYWIDAVRRETPRLPVDFPGGWAANTVESGLTVGATLTPEETQTLLQEVPSVYRTQINDALLAALARAFADCTGSPSLLIDLEAHGREPLFDDVDLSRTVGWFTTHFPVRLDLDGASDAVGALLAVKEQLRRVPGHGIGHALLVHEGGPDAAPLRAAPPAQVSFNYLGQFDQMVAVETLFRLTREPAGATRNPRSHRTHLIEVGGLVAGGRLQFGFSYSKNLYRRETIERLAASFGAALRDLITRCRMGEEVALSTSDFPLVNLDEKSFSKLSALLDDED